jgi:hypothetical protein
MRAIRLLVAVSAFLGTAMPIRTAEIRIVEYDIDGDAKYANVTWTNKSSSTEQKQLMFPVHESFLAQVGTLAYVSAQKARVFRDPGLSGRDEMLSDGVHGTVHVTIRINSKLVGEASSDAPYGIAKASAPVE